MNPLNPILKLFLSIDTAAQTEIERGQHRSMLRACGDKNVR